jgi:hypothetical protein
MEQTIIDMSKWYALPDALKRLSANCGKTIDARYLRWLAGKGKIEQLVISERVRLFSRSDVDGYVVEARGAKVARVQRQKAASRTPITRLPGKSGRPRKEQGK